MALRTGQFNFSRGEISEELIARVDVPAYSSALRRARNVTILKYGGVTKRPGTRFVARAWDDTNPVRLFPFQFSLSQTYALEMGQGYMRPAANGGLVMETRLTIQALTRGATTLIQANYHDFNVGDQVFFDDAIGATWLNGKLATVLTVPTANTFTVNINSTGKAALTGDANGIIRTSAPAPPPAPPTVPPIVAPPTDPVVGAGSFTGTDYTYCVTADTLILMADGTQRAASAIKAGEMLHTQHEETMEWGDYPVAAIEFAEEDVFAAAGYPNATAHHRFWKDGWVEMRDIGTPAGRALVAKITVTDAHTYFSAGVLSHNIKYYPII